MHLNSDFPRKNLTCLVKTVLVIEPGGMMMTMVMTMLTLMMVDNYCRICTVLHPGTFFFWILSFQKILKNYSGIVCFLNVTDCMCIYCHYRRLRTRSRLDIQRFHQIDEFMILRHPGTLKVVQYK